MKITRLPMLATLALALCGACTAISTSDVGPSSHELLPTIEEMSCLGVIIPAQKVPSNVRLGGIRVGEYWTPALEDVAAFEANLKAALQLGLRDPDSIGATLDGRSADTALLAEMLTVILDSLPDYRRQYVGIVTSDGSRRVLANCFLLKPKGPVDSRLDWRRGYVAVFDGGPAAWRIQFDVDAGKFSHFVVNGYA